MKTSSPVRLVDGNNVAEITSDGELRTTETEREHDVFSQYTNIFNATEYVILVSKDNPLFPHKRQGQNGGRIDVTSIYYAIDLAANTTATIRYGVITRINGVNADIKYFAGIPFLTGATKDIKVVSLRGVPSQVKLDFNDAGTLLHGITNSKENNVAAVRTGLALDSPAGSIFPGLGDVILKYEWVGGSSTFATFLFYHNTD
jgi:hypothetical protein